MNSSIHSETPVTVGAEVNIDKPLQSIEERDESRTVNDNDDNSPQHMISKLTESQLYDTFIHLLHNNIKPEHKKHFHVAGGRLEKFGVNRDVKVIFDGDHCVETTLTAAKKSVHRGKQLARITKGVIGWKNHNCLCIIYRHASIMESPSTDRNARTSVAIRTASILGTWNGLFGR